MKSTVLLAALALTVASCSKDGEKIADCRTCGEMKIIVDLKHHNKMIDSGMVYIKYNTTDKATTYDDSAVVVRTPTAVYEATFYQKKFGSYYVFAKGFDKSLQQTVEGGVPVAISNDYAQTGYVLTVPVTEPGH
ncbi:MAG: hypothetical protein H3C54_15395 [Taibaiella sp.]|nr:hypothetical protein [Taibaiella sp.]